MDWIYFAALSAAAISGNFYQVTERPTALRPMHRWGRTLFYVAGFLSAVMIGMLLVGGFFFEPWWQPLAALALAGALSAGAERVLSREMAPQWAVLFASTAVGLTVGVIVHWHRVGNAVLAPR